MVESEMIFLALKLIDDATLFSKENVIKEYEKNKNAENLTELLHDKSIYPNGEKLGFYNISKFTFNYFMDNISSEKEFEEYLNGFSIEVRELFNIINIDRSIFYKYPLITEEEWEKEINSYSEKTQEHLQQMNVNYSKFNKNHSMNNILSSNGKYTKNKEDVQNIFINRYFKPNPYFNYDEFSNFLRNVLFYNVELKEKISMLHIYPDTPFIFECINYILKYNPECDVNLYIIAKSNYDLFPLKFLAIINKINFNYFIDDSFRPNQKYHELFKKNGSFDFVIRSPGSRYINLRLDKILLDHISVSSRIVYSYPFSDVKAICNNWLENDLLESLISIPIYDVKSRVTQPHEIRPHLLVVLNYNKSKERRNKFIIIDNNKNKTITTKEYRVENYIDLINNDNIYENSFKQFSKFTRAENSTVISIDEIVNNYKKERNMFYININDLLYESKMNSQKNYYKINHLKKDSTNKEHIVTKQLNYPIVKLGNLVEVNTLSSLKSNDVLYALTNETNVDKWVFLDFEIKNRSLYNKMKLISDEVSLEYLYYYLNSQIGINEYEYFIRGHPVHNRGEFFKNIRIPIPPKEVQDRIVNALNYGKNFFNEVYQLENRINNNFFNHERNLKTIEEFYGNRNYSKETQEVSITNNWEYTLSGLVWPLAITYLLATSGGFEKVETANNLLRLFEFTTAFNSIVLISALPKEIYEKYKSRIWDHAYDKRDNDKKFNNKLKLSFGSWVEFSNLLSSAYKKEFQTELNKEFYINLLNKEIRKYYTKLKDDRNDEFHGGITNAYDAKILINELDIPKARIFEHLNSCYNNFKLYYTTGRHDYKTNNYEVIFLNGAYSMPIYSSVTYDGLLEPESLYLHDTVNDKYSKLNDELIKFKAIDETKRDWRLYIFIGFETINGMKKARYRCYQRREDDLLEDIDLDAFM